MSNHKNQSSEHSKHVLDALAPAVANEIEKTSLRLLRGALEK